MGLPFAFLFVSILLSALNSWYIDSFIFLLFWTYLNKLWGGGILNTICQLQLIQRINFPETLSTVSVYLDVFFLGERVFTLSSFLWVLWDWKAGREGKLRSKMFAFRKFSISSVDLFTKAPEGRSKSHGWKLIKEIQPRTKEKIPNAVVRTIRIQHFASRSCVCIIAGDFQEEIG